MPLLDRVRRFVAAHALAGPGSRVVVALSGGSDSVALAHLVRELEANGQLRAAGLAHFNHQLRKTADRDEQFSVRLAESFGWPITIERADVAARARRERRSIEDAARRARHEFFERARVGLDADHVALGHTRDDQAETFLLRLLRGAGPKGLASMHPRHGAIVRPLLCCRRRELRGYLAARGIDYVEDESNADVQIPRNRVRAELLPLLERRFNPSVVEVLADEAALARETWEWLEAAADRLLTESVQNPTAGSRLLAFDVAALAASPPPVRRFALWRGLSDVAEGRAIAFDHVQAVMALLDGETRRSLDLPGQTVERLGSQVVLRGTGAARGRARAAASADLNVHFDYPLPLPGEVLLPQAGCVLVAEDAGEASPIAGLAAHAPGDHAESDSGLREPVLMARSPGTGLDLSSVCADPATAVVRRDRCTGPWRVRNRRPGDRFRPMGMAGQKKLQDFFVDRKIARQRRDLVPLVVDEQDRIVWVAGFGIDEMFRVTDVTQAVIILRLKLLGGFA